jgi:membrane protein required for colicin V production
MHPFDIVALVVLLIFLFWGMKDGLIEGIFQLLAAVGGFAGAFYGYKTVYDAISFLGFSPHNLTVISFVIAFFVFLFAILIIGWFVKKVIHLTPIGWIDRLLGGLFGFLKASILIWIFTLSVLLLPQSHLKSRFTESFTYHFFMKFPLRMHIPSLKEIKKLESTINKNFNANKKKLDELKKKIDYPGIKEMVDSI